MRNKNSFDVQNALQIGTDLEMVLKSIDKAPQQEMTDEEMLIVVKQLAKTGG